MSVKLNKLFLFPAILSAVILGGCGSGAQTTSDTTAAPSSETDMPETQPEETTVTEAPQPEPTSEEKAVAKWFKNSMKDSEEFTDISDYRYYARALGLDKDYFLDPQMWEIFCNDDINLNKDINGKEIYLIRLDPYKLLDIYAENNDCSVDELCLELSATKEQLYYNWGYNPSSRNYTENHSKMKASYSDKEKSIFGIANGENRIDVMSTHTLTVDCQDNYLVTYSSSVGSTLEIRRRDMLSAYTEEKPLYSEYTEAERNAAFTVNGIGIRAVIPVTIPNAWSEAIEADAEITPLINVSPYSYGCTTADKVDIISIIESEETDQ